MKNISSPFSFSTVKDGPIVLVVSELHVRAIKIAKAIKYENKEVVLLIHRSQINALDTKSCATVVVEA